MSLMKVYSCGCYQDATCALTKKEADCIYYEKCTTGSKSPVLLMCDETEGYILDNI